MCSVDVEEAKPRQTGNNPKVKLRDTFGIKGRGKVQADIKPSIRHNLEKAGSRQQEKHQ